MVNDSFGVEYKRSVILNWGGGGRQLATHVGVIVGAGGEGVPLLLVSSVVSVVTSERTGSAVCVIFSSHADSSSFSFLLPLPLLFPPLTVSPFLVLLFDGRAANSNSSGNAHRF